MCNNLIKCISYALLTKFCFSDKHKYMTYTEWLDENCEKDNMFPPCLEPQEALLFLEKYLLGEDYYIVNPMPNIQANCEVVHDILYKYSRKYRKEVKERDKLKKK